MGEVTNFRPFFETRHRESADDAPVDVDALISFLTETLGAEHLAEVRAKYSASSPEAYERQKVETQIARQARLILDSLDIGSSAFLSHVILARAYDSAESASSAALSLLPLVQQRDAVSSTESAQWSDVAVERVLRDYMATLTAGGTCRRKTQYPFSAPPPLTRRQLDLVTHMRTDGRLSAFARLQGHTASWMSRQRIACIWACAFNEVPIPGSLLDFRRGVKGPDQKISDEVCALFSYVLRTTCQRLDPLIVEARQRIEAERAP